jgi:hypothetical protein
MRHRLAAAFVCFLVSAVVVGCNNDNMADVTGTVAVDGKPVAKGSIGFIPADGKAQTAGAEIKDGKYSARVPIGNSKIEIRVPKVVGKKKLYDTPDSPVQDLMAETLPEKYNEKTELTFEVKPGTNEKNWELSTK